MDVMKLQCSVRALLILYVCIARGIQTGSRVSPQYQYISHYNQPLESPLYHLQPREGSNSSLDLSIDGSHMLHEVNHTA